MATIEVLLKRVPESVLVSLLKFWENDELAEWTVNRHDRQFKVEKKGFERGTY